MTDNTFISKDGKLHALGSDDRSLGEYTETPTYRSWSWKGSAETMTIVGDQAMGIAGRNFYVWDLETGNVEHEKEARTAAISPLGEVALATREAIVQYTLSTNKTETDYKAIRTIPWPGPACDYQIKFYGQQYLICADYYTNMVQFDWQVNYSILL